MLVLDELAARRVQRCKLRLVGWVAARDDSAEVDFDERLGGEDDPEVEIEEKHDLTRKRWGLVRVRGGSMQRCGIDDGDLLLVQEAELDYQRGQTVIARTGEHGMVCKRYDGERRGTITLKSCGEGLTIRGKRVARADDILDIEDWICVQAIVREVIKAKKEE